jgi:hypothetical protein
MHKKIKSELVNLAHSILDKENTHTITTLHHKAKELYEKLTILKFVDSNIHTELTDEVVSDETVDKKDLIHQNEKPLTASINEEILIVPDENEIISEEQVEEIFGIENTLSKDDEHDIPSIQNSLEEEFKDAISADVATELFERATKENPTIEDASADEKNSITSTSQKKSLNDTLFKNNLQIGLNDRIAFVKHLFEGNQGDFNRVLSQLNSFKSEQEAKNFINTLVKPDYDWSNKEEYEQRLIELIERKFV